PIDIYSVDEVQLQHAEGDHENAGDGHTEGYCESLGRDGARGAQPGACCGRPKTENQAGFHQLCEADKSGARTTIRLAPRAEVSRKSAGNSWPVSLAEDAATCDPGMRWRTECAVRRIRNHVLLRVH